MSEKDMKPEEANMINKLVEGFLQPQMKQETKSDPFEMVVSKLTRQRDACKREFDELYALIMVNLEHGKIKCDGKEKLLEIMGHYKRRCEQAVSYD